MKKYFVFGFMVVLLLVSSVSFASETPASNNIKVCTEAVKYLDVSDAVKTKMIQGCTAADGMSTTEVIGNSKEVLNQANAIAQAITNTATGLGVAANTFLATDAGKFTAVLIAWRVMGSDLLGIFSSVFSSVGGVCVLLFWWWLFAFIVRRFIYGYVDRFEETEVNGKKVQTKVRVYNNMHDMYKEIQNKRYDDSSMSPNALFFILLFVFIVASFFIIGRVIF